MNKWIKKYLGFYNAILSRTKRKNGVIHSKLNGGKTTLKITMNLVTFYNVMRTKFRDDPNVSVHINDDKDHVSIASDNKQLLKDIMFEYGGYIDEFGTYGKKYTLQVMNLFKKDEITASI